MPSLSFGMSSSARADATATQTADQKSQTSAAGNRGFVNNFAAAGANLRADQGINEPAASRTGLYLAGAAAAGLLLFLWWRKHKH